MNTGFKHSHFSAIHDLLASIFRNLISNGCRMCELAFLSEFMCGCMFTSNSFDCNLTKVFCNRNLVKLSFWLPQMLIHYYTLFMKISAALSACCR